MALANRHQLRFFFALLGLGLGFALIDARGADTGSNSSSEDPFPIHRVLLPKDRLAVELERVKNGTLVQIAREEFEKRVRAARARLPVQAPRLVAAHYRARLVDQGLDENSLSGTAEWKVVHAGPGAGLLPINGLLVALKQARWTDNRPAVIGLLSPDPQAGLALVVDEPGEQSVNLEWSARGLPEIGELRFDLGIPISPVATLEIDIPGDLKPHFPQDDVAIIDSPPLDDKNARKSWKVACGGLDHIEVVLRPANTSGQSALPVLTSSVVTQELTPGLLACHAQIDFQAVRGELTDLVLEYDPDLTITDVAVPDLLIWQNQKNSSAGKKRILIRLSDPARGGQLRVTATAALPFNESQTWISPQIHWVGAISRGEKLRLRLSPDLRLLEWRPGTFELLGSEFAADHFQTLTLEPGLLPDAAPSPIRPSARLRSAGMELRVHQRTDWEIAARSTLTSQLRVEVVRGSLNQLSLRVPAGWDVERIDNANDNQRPIWTLSGGGNPQVSIEMPRPVPAGGVAQLSVRLTQRLPRFGSTGRLSLPFPDLVPLNAAHRFGEYGVRVNPALQAIAPAPPDRTDTAALGPPYGSLSDTGWIYPFFGHPPVGPILLQPRDSRASATVANQVAIGFDGPATTVKLTIKPELGAISSLVVATSDPVNEPMIWKTLQGVGRVRSVDLLPAGAWLTILEAPTPWQALAKLAKPPRTRWWRMNFAKPVEDTLVLETTIQSKQLSPRFWHALTLLGNTRSLPAAFAHVAGEDAMPRFASRQPVPLLMVRSVATAAESVDLRGLKGSGWEAASTGLTPNIEAAEPGTPVNFEIVDRAPALEIVHRANSIQLVGNPMCDQAELTVVASLDGRHRCLLRARYKNEFGSNLLVQLPPAADIQSILVGGRPIAPELCVIESPDHATCCTLPFPGGAEWRHVEVLYSVPASTWNFYGTLKPTMPILPVKPRIERVEWRLPPGVWPVMGSVARLPGGGQNDRSFTWPLLHDLVRDPSESWHATEIGTRIAATNRQASSERTFEQWLATEKPILDLRALEELEILRDTVVGRGSIEKVGLATIAIPGAQVLTSPRQFSLWKTREGSTQTVAPAIREAIMEAMRHGRDRSGRFRTVEDWLEMTGSREATLAGQLGGDGPGWTAWEVPSSLSSIRVVQTTTVTAVGWLIGGVLALVGWLFLVRWGRIGDFLLLLWLFASGAALISLPPPLTGLALSPFVVGVIVGLVKIASYRPASRDPRSQLGRISSHGRVIKAGTLIAVGWLVIGFSGRADTPESNVVFLVPTATGDGEPHAVLAPPDLLERLTLLAEPRLALVDGAYLRARYTGRADANGLAVFEASFDIACFKDQVSMPLSLGDVRLREVLLDGAAAFPKAAGNDRVIIEVKGAGEHRIDVQFSMPLAGSESDREIRFNTPETAICQIDFTAPDKAQYLRAANWRGTQTLSNDGTRLQADLGRTRQVQVRWRHGVDSAQALVTVQEASIWDIAPSAATSYTAIDYRIAHGSLNALNVNLPANLQVTRVEVRPEIIPVGSPPTWVRNWSVSANRILRVDLQAAVTGNVRLLIEAIPNRPLTNRPLLQAPSAANVSDSKSLFAYRLRGLEAGPDLDRKGAADYSPELFYRDIWRTNGIEKSPAPLTKAFRREKGAALSLRPLLSVKPIVDHASQDLIWWPGTPFDELRGMAHWSAVAQPVSFVAWTVPASLTVHDVRGLTVQSWLRTGNQVIAWLREPTREVSLRWSARIPRNGMPVDNTLLEAPTIRQEGAEHSATVMRLRVPEGWVVWPENAAILATVLPSLAERELAVPIPTPGPSPRFQLRGPQADARFNVRQIAQVVDRRLELSATIETNLRRDRPHAFTLSLRNADGWSVANLETARCSAAAAGVRQWRIDVPANDRVPPSITLRLQRPLDSVTELPLPEIGIRMGDRPILLDKRLKLQGPEIRERAMIGWRPVVEPVDNKSLPRDREVSEKSPASWWHADGAEDRASIQAFPNQLSALPAVRITHADVQAAGSKNGWVNRGRFDLQFERGSEVRVVMPPNTALEGIALERIVWPLPEHRDEWSIPSPAEGGKRTLQLVWTSATPSWQLPRFQSLHADIEPSGVNWMAITRPGDQIDGRDLQPITGETRRSGSGDSVWEQLPFADIFQRGLPVRWSGAAGDVHIQPALNSSILPTVASLSLLATAILVLGLFNFVLGQATRPEQVALLGMVGQIAFGVPDGLLFLPIILFGFGMRSIWLIRKLLRWLGA